MGAIFTYLMTYGGSALSLVRPFHGFLIYVCFAIIKPPALWHWSVPAGNHSRIIAVGFCSAGWSMVLETERLEPPGQSLFVCSATGSGWSFQRSHLPTLELGFPFIEYMAKIAIPVVAGLTLIQSQRDLKWLLWTIVFSCGYLAYEANLAYLNEFDFANGRFRNLDNNSFSILIVTGFGAALVLGFLERKLWVTGGYLLMAAAMAHVPMLSFSRGGMVGVAIASASTIWIVPKNKKAVFLLLAGIVAGSILAGPSVVEEFSTVFAEEEERDASAQSRVDLWIDCTDAMLNNPITGVGQEHWGLIAPRYGWNEGKEAHSLWFQTAAELGIPGIGFLVLFYGITVAKCYRLSRDRSIDPEYAKIAMASIAALVGFAVSASFVTVEGFELPFYVVLLAAGTLKLAHQQRGLHWSVAPHAPQEVYE